MPKTVPGGTCRSTPRSASTFPNRLARLSTTIAGSVIELAILPTTPTSPSSHPSPSCGYEPVRHADPPLARVVGTLPHHVETAVGPRTHRNAETLPGSELGGPDRHPEQDETQRRPIGGRSRRWPAARGG